MDSKISGMKAWDSPKLLFATSDQEIHCKLVLGRNICEALGNDTQMPWWVYTYKDHIPYDIP